MKSFACHRVYTHPNHYMHQAFVTLDEQRKVVHFATFTEEMRATEWIGGVIILSDTDVAPTENFRSWFVLHSKTDDNPTYAWHLSEFDFEREEPTPTCIIRRL